MAFVGISAIIETLTVNSFSCIPAGGPPLTLTPATGTALTAGTVRVAYGNVSISATGGSSAITYSASGLPTGLSMNATTGVISGIPTVAGNFTVTVTATAGTDSVSQTYSLHIGAQPELSVVGVSIMEGDSGRTSAVLIISLTEPAPPGGVMFDIATVDDTAIAGEDYEPVSRSGAIGPGSRAVWFSVDIFGDTVVEPDERFFVNFTNITGAIPGNTVGIVTILNDDVAPAPTIYSATPYRGPTAGGTTVTIIGTGLTNASSVTFGGVPAFFTIISSTQIVAQAPAHTAGFVEVSVITPGGSATLGRGFEYIDPPTITSISPNIGPTTGGTRVTVTGTSLISSSVTVGGVSTPPTAWTFDSLQFETPPHSAGTFDIVITTEGGSATAAGGFTYVAPLPALSINDVEVFEGDSGTTFAVFSISLDRLAPSGGVTFDVATADGTATAGEDYLARSEVGLTIEQSTSSREFAVEIIGDTTVELNETFFVNVTNVSGATVAKGQGRGTIVNDDTAPLPRIESVAPDSGPTTGGTTVIIAGTDFDAVTGVTFGGVAAAIVSKTATSITVTTPPHAVGSVDVTVTGPDGGDTATGSYSYQLPTLTFSPAPGALPSGMIGMTYNEVVTASQGNAPYSYALTAGSLPLGLSLDPSTGAISGTPTAMETANFTIRATDANGATGSAAYIIGIADQVPIARAVSATVPANSSGNAITLDITEGMPISVAVATQPDHGIALASGTTITYTPAAGYSGPDWFTYTATNASGTSVEAPVTITVTPPSLEFSPAAGTLLGGMVGVTYYEVVTASKGNAPYSYAVTVGALPAGLSLDPSTGVISGTPTTIETASFTITATDANGASGAVAYVIDVADQIPISGAVAATVAANSSANPISLDISGGTATSVAVGTQPGHGTATPETSGTTIIYTPTAGYSGPDSFTYIATNASGSSPPATVTITVTPPVLLFSPIAGALPGGMVGTIFDQAITASQGMAPYRYEVTAGALPAGLVLDPATGRISGTPTTMETASFTVTATDANGAPGSAAYTIDIADQVPVATAISATVAANSPGDVISLNITGGTPVSVAVTSPASHGTATASGLTITYTPTPGYSGSDSFTYTASNATGSSAAAIVTITVTAPTLVFSPAAGTLPGGTAGTTYGQTITASGGTAPYSYTVTSGALPAGLTLSSQGEITGTPTTAGNADFTITVTDVYGASSSSVYTLAVAVQLPVANAISATVAANSSANSLTLDISGGLAASVAVVSAPGHGTAHVSGLEISYTPAAGFSGIDSFTYTATNASGTSEPATVTIIVSPPSLVFTPPSGALAGGVVGTAYKQEITVEGGAAPYNFTSTSLPEGLTLDPSMGTIAGTPIVDGTSSIDVTVTDANGASGTVRYSLVIRAAPPIATDKDVELLAGTSATVDLVADARGGPFTAAAIVNQPSSGTASISGSDGAYRLAYTADITTIGTVIVRYTLSSAAGTSAPATITFTVIARSDPSTDPEVIGLVNAQVQTAQRFATTQIQNFNDRLERLHDDGARETASFGIRFGTPQNSDPNDPLGYVEEDLSDDPIGRAMRMPHLGSHTGSDLAVPSSDSRQAGRAALAFWAGGFVNFGTASGGSADINLDHTLVGVSGGVDYRFTPDFVGGIGLGYGRDRTNIGANGTTSTGQALSAAIYGSYHPAPLFLDGLVGLSRLDFASTRFVTSTGDTASGDRDGTQVFGSLSAGYEYKQDGLTLSPYGRIQAAFTKLDAFSESGSGLDDLIFASQSLNMIAGVAGLRGEYAMPMDWGVLATRGRVEYTYDFAGSSDASMGYADLGATPYSLDLSDETRDYVTIGLGLDATLAQGLTLSFDYRTSFVFDSDGQDHSFGLQIGGRF